MVDIVLYKFQPDAMDKEILERLFVGERRREIIEKLAKDIKEAAKNKTPRYYLIIGPRGVGKTHFITLLYYKIKNSKEILPVKLFEEEFSIYRVSDLFLRIIETLGKVDFDWENLEDDEITVAVLEDLKGTGKMVVIFIENLNQILGEQMSEKEVKKLRSILQRENIFTIVATAPLIFPQVSKHEEPFFNFFQIIYLPELTKDELKELIRRVAEIENDKEFLTRIDEIESKIESIRILTGGSPRIAILLYDLMSKGKLIDVEKAFFKLLDENTPYYQDVFRSLSAEKRKIFDTLIALGKPATPKEIAKKARLDEKSVNTQLRRLEKDGYVISHKVGRFTKYEVRERLFRLWRELRREPFGRKRLSILIEFLELWYSEEERLKRFLECLKDLQDEIKIKEASYWFSSLSHEDKEALLPEIVQKVCEIGDFKVVDEIIPEKELKNKAFKDYILKLMDKREYEKVLKEANEILSRNSKSFLGWHLKTISLINLKRYEEALEASSKAVELRPNDPCAWCGKGRALEALGRYEEALEAFIKAIELKPEDFLIWFYKGITLKNLGRHEDALEAFSKAIELNPENAQAWFNKGLVLKDLGKHEEALDAFTKATELNPNDALAWFYKGATLIDLERYEEALDAFSKTIELEPRNAHAWFGKGLALRELKKYGEALEAFSKAIELRPSFGCAWCYRGFTLIDLERYEEALKALSKAEKLIPSEDSCVNYIRGVTHSIVALEEFKNKNYRDGVKNLSIAMDLFNKVKSEGEKNEMNEIFMDFLKDLIDTKNVEAVEMALNVMFEKREELRELFEPISIAVEIVKNKDTRKYYDVQVEERELIADIVKKLTGSTELIPEEYK